ncbi:MAG: serine protease [Betaproteobacteria bacterium RIFCSPLOWO2_12_FULL_68_19]|nr:MAG: serine protease [Betaproteobacteria bacterium RIFCSPLOWO2_12_FULL_68_19]
MLHCTRFYLALASLWLGIAQAQPAPVVVVPLEGAIGPASADFVGRAIKRAAREKAQLVVVRMDTPGGLDTSMRELIKTILASPVPVASFVAPGGSRAASAGTFILYASHVAAMAPATNLGAASPVSIGAPSTPQQKDDKKGRGADAGDTMTRKVTNDAVAYIRGLAEMRGRNADWAERAVREAVSLSSEQALKLKVIDVVAADVPELLRKLEGRKLKAAGENLQLHTSGAPVTQVEVDWRTRILAAITNPSIAYILILVGIYALIFEFMNPGLILPGVVGAICLLIALYAFHLLPVNYAGLALIGLGIAFMVAEAFLPSFGALGAGGLIAFVIGSIILIPDTDLPGFEIPYTLIGGVAAASAAFLFFVVGMAVRNRVRPVVSGREYLIGASAVALEDFEREGWARVQGETWRVRSPQPVRQGQALRVTAIQGLTLTVEVDR